MRVDLSVYLCAWVLLILLALLFCRFWQGGQRAPAVPKPPKRQREPKPFAGLTRKPDCPLCEQEAGVQPSASAPHAPPPRMTFTRGRRRHAAEHLAACSRYVLRDVYVEQGQRDACCALLSAVKEGEITETEAIKRLSRSPNWGWVAMDPVCKLILAVDVGDRPLVRAQRFVHQLTQVRASHWAPLLLTDGFGASLPALVPHDGRWVHPERRQAKGPQPKPRWMPRPGLLYAQVVKCYRRRRIVGGTHRVIFGAAKIIESILAKRGWKSNSAFVERLQLDFRQHVAAIGRRVNTLCKHAVGLRPQLAWFHPYHNFVLPHASWRLPLPELESIPESGAIKRWPPRTPTMAAGLTDRVWSGREVRRYRVPP